MNIVRPPFFKGLFPLFSTTRLALLCCARVSHRVRRSSMSALPQTAGRAAGGARLRAPPAQRPAVAAAASCCAARPSPVCPPPPGWRLRRSEEDAVRHAAASCHAPRRAGGRRRSSALAARADSGDGGREAVGGETRGSEAVAGSPAGPGRFGVPQRWLLVAATSLSFVLCVRARRGGARFRRRALTRASRFAPPPPLPGATWTRRVAANRARVVRAAR